MSRDEPWKHPADGLRELQDKIAMLNKRVNDLEYEVRELRRLVTPFDRGTLPNKSEEQER